MSAEGSYRTGIDEAVLADSKGASSESRPPGRLPGRETRTPQSHRTLWYEPRGSAPVAKPGSRHDVTRRGVEPTRWMKIGRKWVNGPLGVVGTGRSRDLRHVARTVACTGCRRDPGHPMSELLQREHGVGAGSRGRPVAGRRLGRRQVGVDGLPVPGLSAVVAKTAGHQCKHPIAVVGKRLDERLDAAGQVGGGEVVGVVDELVALQEARDVGGGRLAGAVVGRDEPPQRVVVEKGRPGPWSGSRLRLQERSGLDWRRPRVETAVEARRAEKRPSVTSLELLPVWEMVRLGLLRVGVRVAAFGVRDEAGVVGALDAQVVVDAQRDVSPHPFVELSAPALSRGVRSAGGVLGEVQEAEVARRWRAPRRGWPGRVGLEAGEPAPRPSR